MAKSSNGRTESFEKTLFKTAYRKYRKINGNSRKIVVYWGTWLRSRAFNPPAADKYGKSWVNVIEIR
jgi:hypothetical protein